MAAASEGKNVRIHYTGRLTDGTVFDTSEGREPFGFTVGAGEVISGFDTAVEGMAAGDERTVTIPAVEAYGPRRQDLVLDVPRQQLPADMELEPGKRLHMETQDGRTFQVTIMEVHDDHLKLDANHPLAGQDLTFDIQMVQVA